MSVNYIQVASVQFFFSEHGLHAGTSLQLAARGGIGRLSKDKGHPAHLLSDPTLGAFCLQQVHLVNGSDGLCSFGGAQGAQY